MRLNIENRLTKVNYDFDVDDINESGMFYVFELELPEGVDDGDYEYNLYDDDTLVATGIIRIGEYVNTSTAYTGNNDNYIVYNG